MNILQRIGYRIKLLINLKVTIMNTQIKVQFCLRKSKINADGLV